MNNTFSIEDYVNGSIGGSSPITFTDVTKVRNYLVEQPKQDTAPGYGLFDWARDAASSVWRGAQESDMKNDQDRMAFANYAIDNALSALEAEEDEEILNAIDSLRKAGVWSENRDPNEQDLIKIIQDQKKQFEESQKSYFENKQEYDDSLNNYDISQWYTRRSNDAVQNWGNWMYKMPTTMGTSWSAFDKQMTSMVGTIVGSAIGSAGTGAILGSSVAPGIGTAIGTAVGAIAGAITGQITGGIEARKQESHMEAFMGYSEKVKDLAEKAGVNLSAIADNTKQQLNERGIDTTNMTNDMLIEYALSDRSIQTGSTQFNEIADNEFAASRRVYDRNNALGLGEVVSDLSYIFPIRRWGGNLIGKLFKPAIKGAKKLVPNALMDGLNLRFSKGLEIAAAGAIARNRTIAKDAWGFVKDSMFRGVIEGTEEGAQAMIVDEYKAGKYDNEYANEGLPDIDDLQSWTDLGETVGLRAKALSAWVGLNDEYKDDQQMSEEMWSGFLLSMINPQGLMVGGPQVAVRLNTLMQLPKVSKYLQQSLEKQDAIQGFQDYFKNLREGLPSGRTWNEALDILANELKTVKADGKTRNYNLDPLVLTDGQTIPTNEDVDAFIEEQKSNADQLSAFYKVFQKTLKKNNISVPEEDQDLYAALTVGVRAEQANNNQLSNILKGLQKAFTMQNTTSDEFKNDVNRILKTSKDKTAEDYTAIAAINDINMMLDYLIDRSSSTPSRQRLKNLLKNNGYLSKVNALDDAKIELAYQGLADELIKERDSLINQFKKYHEDVDTEILQSMDLLSENAEFQTRGRGIARSMSDAMTMSRLLEEKEKQYMNPTQEFVEQRVKEYKDMLNRQRALADNANAAARNNTEPTVVQELTLNVTDMTKDALITEKNNLEQSVTKRVAELDNLLHSIPEGSHLSNLVKHLDKTSEFVKNDPLKYARHLNLLIKRLKYQYGKGEEFEAAPDEVKKQLEDIVTLANNLGTELDQILRLNTEAKAKAVRHNAGLKTTLSNSRIWRDANGNEYTLSREDTEYSENEGAILTFKPVEKQGMADEISKIMQQLRDKISELEKDSIKNPNNKDKNEKRVNALKAILDSLNQSEADVKSAKIIVNAETARPWLETLQSIDNQGNTITFKEGNDGLDAIVKYVNKQIEANKKTRNERANMAFANSDPFDFLLNDATRQEEKKADPKRKQEAVKFKRGDVRQVKTYSLQKDGRITSELLNPHHGARHWYGYFTMEFSDPRDIKEKFGERATFTRDGVVYDRVKAAETYNDLGRRIARAKDDKKYNAEEVYGALEKLFQGSAKEKILGKEITASEYWNMVYATPFQQFLMSQRTGKQRLKLVMHDLGSVSKWSDYSQEEREARAEFVHTLLNKFKTAEQKTDEDVQADSFMDVSVEESKPDNEYVNRFYFSPGQVRVIPNSFNYNTSSVRNENSKLFQNADGTSMNNEEVRALYDGKAPAASDDARVHLPKIIELLKKLNYDKVTEDILNQLDEKSESNFTKLVKGVLKYGDGVITAQSLSAILRDTCGTLAQGTRADATSRAKDLFEMFAEIIPEHFVSYSTAAKSSYSSYPIAESIRVAMTSGYFKGKNSIKIYRNDSLDATQRTPINLTLTTDENIEAVTKIFKHFLKVLEDSRTASEFLETLKADYTFVQTGGQAIAERTLREYFNFVKFGRLRQNGNLAQVFSTGKASPNDEHISYEGFDRHIVHNQESLLNVGSLGIVADEDGRYHFSIDEYVKQNASTSATTATGEKVKTEYDIEREQSLAPIKSMLELVEEIDFLNGGKRPTNAKIQEIFAQYEVSAKNVIRKIKDEYFTEKEDGTIKANKNPGLYVAVNALADALRNELENRSINFLEKYQDKIKEDVKKDEAFDGKKHAYVHFAVGSFRTKTGVSVIYKDNQGQPHPLGGANGTPGAIYLILPGFFSPSGEKQHVKLNPQRVDTETATFLAHLLNDVRTGKIKMDTVLSDNAIDKYHIKTNVTVKTVLDQFVFNGTDAITNDPEADHNFEYFLHVDAANRVNFGNEILTDDNFDQLVEFLSRKPRRIDMDKITDINALNGVDIQVSYSEEGESKQLISRSRFKNYVATVLEEGLLRSDLAAGKNQKVYEGATAYTTFTPATKLSKPVANSTKSEGSAKKEKLDVANAVSAEEVRAQLAEQSEQELATLGWRTLNSEVSRVIKKLFSDLKSQVDLGTIDAKNYKIGVFLESGETFDAPFGVSWFANTENPNDVGFNFSGDSSKSQLDLARTIAVLSKMPQKPKRALLYIIDENGKTIKVNDKRVGTWMYLDKIDLSEYEKESSPTSKTPSNQGGIPVDSTLQNEIKELAAGLRSFSEALKSIGVVQSGAAPVLVGVQGAPQQASQPFVPVEIPVRKISFEWEGVSFDMNSGLNKQQFTTEAKKIEPGLGNEDVDEVWEIYQTVQSGNTGTISANQMQSAQPINVGGTAPISPLGAVLSSTNGNAVSGPAPVEQKERLQPAQETFTIPSVTELLKWVEAQKGVDERKKIEQSMKSDNRVDIPLSAAYSEYMRKTQGWTLKQIRERNAELTDKIRQAKVAYTLPHKNLASILNFNDKHVEKEDYQEALKIVKEMLGDLVIKELDVISQEFDEAREANLYVYGMFTEPAIYIYKQLVEGTEKIFAGGLYHEAFHRVSLFYFSERDRKRMYEKAREQHPELKDRSDAYVEEWLAEEFAARVLQWKKQGVPQNKYSDNFIFRSFQKLFNLIKKVVERFKTNHLSDDIDLNELFRKMYAGRYAYARATKNNKELFRKLYEGRVAFGGVLVNNSVVADNALQFAEIKRDLLARLINNLGLAQLAEGGVFADVDLVKAELIKEVAAEERTAATIEQFIDDPSKLPESLRNRDIMQAYVATIRRIEVYNNILKDDVWEIWSKTIKDFVNQKFGIPEEDANATMDAIDDKEGGKQALGYSEHRDSVNRDVFEELSLSMKALLWSVVDGDVNNPASLKFTPDGLQIYAQVSQLYNKVIRIVNNSDNVTDMMEKLKSGAELEIDANGDYTLQQFYARLLPNEDDPSARILRNNVYSAFVRHIHSFQNYVYESEEHTWTDAFGKEHVYYTYLGSVRNGNLDTVSKNIRNSWRRALTMAFTAIADGGYTDLVKYNKPLQDAANELKKNKSKSDKELRAIQTVLEKLNELYALPVKDNDFEKAAKNVLQAKQTETLLQFVKDLTSFPKSAIQEISKGNRRKFGYQAAFKKLTDMGTAFFTLTEQLASTQTPDAKDNSQPGPKNTKVFSIGAYNFITRLFSTRMLRGAWKQRMRKNVYTANSQWLQELLNGAQPKVNTKFSTVIDNDFRDATADIDVAPYEDLMNRMMTILAGQYNAPSLANKRFAAALQGFEFPQSVNDVVSESGTIQNGYVDRFVGYLADEILAIADAMKIRQNFIDKFNEITGKNETVESFSAMDSTQQEELFRNHPELNSLILMLEKTYHFNEKGTKFLKVGDRIVRRQFHINLLGGVGYKFRHFKNIGKSIKFDQETIDILTKNMGGDHIARQNEIEYAKTIANRYRAQVIRHLNRNVVATLETLMNEGLLEKQDNINPLTANVDINDLHNSTLPLSMFSKIIGKEDVKNEDVSGLAIYRLAAYFTVMDSIGLFEFEKLVTGDTAQLKDITAVNKRYSGPVSTIELTAETGVIENDFSNDRLMYSPTYNTLTINTSLVVNKAKFSSDLMNTLGVDVIVDYEVKDGTVVPITDASRLLDEKGDFINPDAPLTKAYISHKNNNKLLGLDSNGNPLNNQQLAERIVDDATDRFLNYLNNDPTDAQVFITAEMWRQLMQRNGRWNYKLEACYNLLENYDKILDLAQTHENELRDLCRILDIKLDELVEKAKQYQKNPKRYGNSYKSYIIDKTSALDATSLKYVYFGEAGERIDGLHALVYDKMSLSPIFKIFADGHQMAEIYKLMTDRNIDLLKTESATKVGGIASFELFDEEGNINTKSLQNAPIQQQYFELLGKQLNTDPHGAGQTALLTQFMKIANMNIIQDALYNVGENELTGNQVTDLYRKIIDDLTTAGQSKFLRSFGIERHGDGTYTIDKRRFMEKLASMGRTQDLPIDTLASFDVDKDGNYIVHPSAVPNLRWIQSRLISQMGKDVIDTATPGMPLYQVASVGYDDIFNTKKIADKHLRMPGEDGSKHMEVKLSIKFFYDIIEKVRKTNPDLKLDTFEQQREFILKNQDLFALSYRVPTQGQNSTIPIKIVDVFPPQRGGIISFPAGVTALTGSDFDIDKMFLARYNYTVDKKGRLQKVKYDINAYLNGEYQTKYQMLNMLLDIYFGVLTSPHHYLSANTPLDVCTAPLSSFARSMANIGKVVNELPVSPKVGDENEIHLVLNKEKRVFNAYKWDRRTGKFKFERTVPINTAVYEEELDMYHTNPVFQTAQKKKNAGSDAGIGPMALNSVFRYFAQIANLRLLPDNYLKTMGITRIDDIYDRNGVDILDITSALINAHVDAVKDNYIGNVNVNGYTFSVTAFMTSTGFGNDTFAFLTQPILKDLAEKWQRRKKGTIVTDPEGSRGQAFFDEVESAWRDKLERFEDKNNVRLGRVSEKEMTVAYLKLATNNIDTAEGVAQQLRYLNAFKHIYEASQYYSDLINVSQIDTKKYGKSVDEIISFSQRVMLAHSEFNTVFENPADIYNSTFLGTKWNKGVMTLLEAFGPVIFEFSSTYRDAADTLCKQYGRYGRYSKEFLRRVGPRLRSVFHIPFFNQYLKERFPTNSAPLKKLLLGDESVAARYKHIRELCYNMGIGFDFFDLVTYNPLAAANYPQFFTVNDLVKSDETVRNQLQASMSELFNAPTKLKGDEGDQIRQWMNDFAVMMFYQTGGTDTNAGGIIKTTVYDILPPQHLANITTNAYGTYNQFVTNLVNSKPVFDQDQLDQAMMLTALTDDEIVPVVEERDVTSMISTNYKFGVFGKSISDVIYVGYKSSQLKLNGQGTFNRFVKVKHKNGDVTLYKLGDILITQRKSDGKMYASPLYFRVNSLGYRNKSVGSFSVRADGAIENGKVRSLIGNLPNFDAVHFSELDEKQQKKITSNKMFNRYDLINVIPAEAVMNYAEYANNANELGPMQQYVRIDAANVVYYYSDGLDTNLKNYAEFKHDSSRRFILISDPSDLSNVPVFDNATVTLIGTLDETIVNRLKSILPANNKYVDENGNISNSKPMKTTDEKLSNNYEGVQFAENGLGNTAAAAYRARTISNARWSQVTIALAVDFATKGEELTANQAGNKLTKGDLSKSVDEIVDSILKQINNQGLPMDNIRLNIAGNSIATLSKHSLTQEEVNDKVTSILRKLLDNGVTISEIRSGGQTGIDEAGVIAGRRLGIKTSILSPKGWYLRGTDGKDVSNEQQFKDRFKMTPEEMKKIGELKKKDC